MTQSYYRGHKIYFADELWIYSDTLQPIRCNKNRLCGKCKQDNTAEGHDTCLGNLPGLMNACCGHGKTREAYVQFLDGFSIHGKKAKIIQKILKGKRNGHTDRNSRKDEYPYTITNKLQTSIRTSDQINLFNDIPLQVRRSRYHVAGNPESNSFSLLGRVRHLPQVDRGNQERAISCTELE